MALAATLLAASATQAAQTGEEPETDVFQRAINYVLTGQVDADPAPEIVDRKACVIVMRDPKFDRYIRYYLTHFNMADALVEKKYSGRRVFYTLNVKGNDVVLEYLAPDRKTVRTRYRSAQVALPGDIELTRKALKIIFSDHCKREKPKSPF